MVAGVSVPCQHIADYYQQAWEGHKCIAYNLLRQGYRAWADPGRPISEHNNLFSLDVGAAHGN